MPDKGTLYRYQIEIFIHDDQIDELGDPEYLKSRPFLDRISKIEIALQSNQIINCETVSENPVSLDLGPAGIVQFIKTP